MDGLLPNLCLDANGIVVGSMGVELIYTDESLVIIAVSVVLLSK